MTDTRTYSFLIKGVLSLLVSALLHITVAASGTAIVEPDADQMMYLLVEDLETNEELEIEKSGQFCQKLKPIMDCSHFITMPLNEIRITVLKGNSSVHTPPPQE